MNFFDVTGCAARIVRPGMTLTAWGNANRPFALCNASLYTASFQPIGTIIENGVMVHNDGNGYGCGIASGEETISFGGPWEKTWQDYLTGYNSPVQGGKYVDPGFSDGYVFDCRLPRIGIGRKHDGTFIITDDNVTLREFAEHAIAMGADTLVNLDGGGSRHLLHGGVLVYQSPRIPYNALAFYKKDVKPTPAESCPYPVPKRNLLIGCRGDDVKWLQWQLTKHGYDCTVDGAFGWSTWWAVWNYQKTWSRVPDGICGPNTRGELLK